MKQPAVYMMTNKPGGVIYTGVTSDVLKRVYQHKSGETAGFTSKYHCHRLVFLEQHDSMESAIVREKQIKAGSRQKKIALIESANPDWRDLYDDIAG